MQRIKNAVYEHRFGLFFFVFLMAYSFIVSADCDWQVSDLTYSFHAIDFSVGFCTRVLPGAICNWLFGTVSEAKVSAYLTVLFLCCFSMIAFMLEKLLIKTKQEHRYAVVILIMFFLTGPGGFTPHVAMFGMFDFYWLLLSALVLMLLDNKYLRVIIIPCMFLMVFIYYGSMLCYVPFLVVVVLFKISSMEDKKEKILLFIVLLVAVAIAVAISVYMMMFEYDNVRMSADELCRMLTERGVRETDYYKDSFYRWTNEQLEERYDIAMDGFESLTLSGDGFLEMMTTVILRVIIHFKTSSLGTKSTHLLLTVPVVFVLLRFLVLQIKENRKNKLKSFSLFCSGGLFFFTFFMSFPFSNDRVRWLSNAVVPLFSFVFYVLYKGDERDSEQMNSIVRAIPMKVIVPYYILYAVTVSAL